jgi:hypothetical protein
MIHMNGGTSNMQMGEIFKIRGGKIHEIERWEPVCHMGPRVAGNKRRH